MIQTLMNQMEIQHLINVKFQAHTHTHTQARERYFEYI